MMTDPGLALFDGGLVRTKNVVSTSDAEHHVEGGRDGGMGGRGIWPGVRRQRDLVGRLARFDKRRRCAEGRLRPDHPAADLHRLPADVRHHYVSVDTRGVRGADEIQRHT